MSGSTTPPAPGAEPAPDRPADDPLAADKRTLIIALIAMIGLVSVGIVSAAVFTGSACEEIAPAPVATGAVTDGDDLTGVFPDATSDELTAIDAQLAALVDRLGPISGIAVVDGAEGLAPTSDGVAAIGPVTSLLASSGDEVAAAVDVGSGVVVGDGDTLTSLARVNDLTGQVDAFASIDATATGALTEIGCVDTATVGTPLAFELDAGGGQLLLFRADEDGDDAELELRDPRQGRLWFARVDVGAAPPGITGERIDGRLGDDLVVLVRRTAPGEHVPLVTAVDRTDGAERWQLGREALATVPDPSPGGGVADEGGSSVLRDDVPQRLQVLALDDEQVVVAITEARDEDAVVAGGTEALGPSIGPGHVIALDARDGTPRWQRSLAAGVAVSAAGGSGSVVWLVLDDGEQARLVGFDAAGDPLSGDEDGVLAAVPALAPSAGLTAPPVAADADGEAIGVAVLGGQVLVARAGGDGFDVEVVDEPDALVPRDVLAGTGRLHVLFGGATPDRGVVVTFDLGG